MKRFLSVLLAAVLMLGVLPLASSPALMVKNPDFDVSVNKDTALVGDTLRWEITNLTSGIVPFSYELAVYWKSSKDATGNGELLVVGDKSFIEVIADKPGVYYTKATLLTNNPYGSGISIKWGDSLLTIVSDELLLDLQLDTESVAIEKGESITGSWSAEGGTPPYTYDYEWLISSNDGFELTEKSAQSSADKTDNIKPLWGDSGTLKVLAKDSAGQTALQQATFTIKGAPVEPLDIQLTLDRNPVPLGEAVKGSCRISDGFPPYTYTYSWYVHINGATENLLAATDNKSTEASSSFTPTFGDSGTLQVQAIDAAGRKGMSEISFDIEGSTISGPLELAIFLNKDSTAIGEEIEGSWYATGGTPPYRFAFYWYVYEYYDESHHSGSILEKAVDETHSNVYRFAPSRGSKGEVLVSVWDSLDSQVYYSEWFDITKKAEPTPTPTPAPTTTPEPTPTAVPTATPEPALKGDATADGKIDILDLVAIIDQIISGTPPKSQENANANSDGTVDIMDLVWIIDRIVGG
ncbi:MAG: hypothetical protein GXY67_08165 [Clostridiales bacterium]|nr:hypothetical protein [Clostridiales bacterium]